ncbi:MAG: hypothetical protein K0Q54_3093 [Methylobacterium brachiatum]|nr:hypothetical protein [Methylobacterium brachiatum]
MSDARVTPQIAVPPGTDGMAANYRDELLRWLRAFSIVLAPITIVLAAALLPSPLPPIGQGPKELPPPLWCSFEFATKNLAHCDTSALKATLPGSAPSMVRKPQNADQAKTLELALRLGFATASNILRLVAILVFAGASAAFFMQPSMRQLWRAVAWFALVAGCAIIGTTVLTQDTMTKMLLVGAIQNAQHQALGGIGDVAEGLGLSMTVNLLLGFAASGSLLAMLCSLLWRQDDHARALQALQFAVVMGAALFSAASYANAQAAAWAKGLLDDSTMSFAMSALDQLPAYWGVVGSFSLIAVGGLTYVYVSNDEVPSDQGGSAFALKTSDGSDFKFFGWLVNAVLVLSPIWTSFKIPALAPF